MGQNTGLTSPNSDLAPTLPKQPGYRVT